MLEARGVFGGYGSYEVVQDVSLCLQNGEIAILVGPNGCGKTTLIKLLCGQMTPTRGEILLDGIPLPRFSRNALARRIAYLPQSRQTPDMTVEKLVLHGRFPWLGYPRVYRAADKAAAEEAMRTSGILSLRDRPVATLSGGERQKACLAMMRAQNADHAALDEPTTWLDIAHQLETGALVRLLKAEGKAVILAIHDINLAVQWADRLLVMKEGRLVTSGRPAEKGVWEAMEMAFGVKIRKTEQLGFSL